MCGIAGILSREPLRPSQLDQLALMSQAMTHRGPDGVGDFRAPHVALTMRRLSIIDVSTGWQPLYDEDESIALIANGEIYNYVELRKQLGDRGHTFKTNGDCEVIVHLYQEHGARCVDHLRGMFAFALWDKRKQTLLLGRDRMGEKPLYLYERDGMLVFGSELKTLLGAGIVPFRLDPRAIDRYFHYQYVPDPETPIQGVRKLGAGHILTAAPNPWTVEETCYWRMEDAPPLEGDPAELIRAELETVSGLVIRSDVPVGIALSGGLDSSAIAVLAARKSPGTIHAFSAGYPGRPHSDERADARALADHLRMPFHEVEISASEMVRSFPGIVGWQDDPIADISGFAYWAISRTAHEHGVPVLLQGQGGDELFWGYPWVTDAVRQSARKSLLDTPSAPGFGDYLELSWPKMWPRRAPIDWLTSLAGLRSSLAHYRRDRISPRERLVFYDLTRQFQTGARAARKIYGPRMRESSGKTTPFDMFTIPLPWPPLDTTMTRLICQSYLLENGIAQGDRLSMASSVELRLPLVDYRLVETVIGLRKTRSDVGLRPKAWFKEAISDVVPDWVRTRPKRGFQPPVRAWHRALFAKHGHLLRDGALVQEGIIQPEAAQRLAEGAFPITETTPLSFTALVLEIWCRQSRSQVPVPPD
jgi:asparagine synthase (glutamine-hydrolysing)